MITDRHLMVTMNAQLRNAHDALVKIQDAARNACSLAELRHHIEQIAAQARRVDMLHEEAYHRRTAANLAQASDE